MLNSNICFTKIYWIKSNFPSKFDFKPDKDKNKHSPAPVKELSNSATLYMLLSLLSFNLYMCVCWFADKGSELCETCSRCSTRWAEKLSCDYFVWNGIWLKFMYTEKYISGLFKIERNQKFISLCVRVQLQAKAAFRYDWIQQNKSPLRQRSSSSPKVIKEHSGWSCRSCSNFNTSEKIIFFKTK